jgi:2-dehydropantoate 2-reductase
MRIAIMGAGSVGSVIGGSLSEHHDVTLIGRKDHVEAIVRNGLVLEGSVSKRTWPKARTEVGRPDIHDLIIITVKSYDAPETYRSIMPMIGPGTRVLIVQNGLDVLRSPLRIGNAPVLIGIASLGASRPAPGRVRLSGLGKMTIGDMEGRTAEATLLKIAFADTCIDVKVTKDIIGAVWRKVIVNASVNPLTALVGCRNGAIMDDERLLSISEELFEEAFAVARSLGILGPGEMSFDDVMKVMKDTSENRSSMLQDIEMGRRTEIDSINGAISSIANDDMAKTNRIIAGLVKAKERQVRGNEQ